jgi:hypothetical protein
MSSISYMRLVPLLFTCPVGSDGLLQNAVLQFLCACRQEYPVWRERTSWSRWSFPENASELRSVLVRVCAGMTLVWQGVGPFIAVALP